MIEIRLLHPSDTEAIIALGERNHQETRHQTLCYAPDKVRAQIDAYFRDKRNKYMWLVGIQGGELKGYLFAGLDEYWFSEDRCANLIAWYVDKSARGSPMAVKLLLAFKNWATNRQAQELTICVTSGLDTGKTARFLKRMGFTACGENFYMGLGGNMNQEGK